MFWGICMDKSMCWLDRWLVICWRNGSQLLNTDALRSLSSEMLNGEVALTQISCAKDLNSLITAQQVLWDLTNGIQYLWAKSVNYMLRCGSDPKFNYLQALVSREVRISRSRSGKLASDSRSYRGVGKPIWKLNLSEDHSEALIFKATEWFWSTSLRWVYPVYKSSRIPDKCLHFPSTDVTGRWKWPKQMKACFLFELRKLADTVLLIRTSSRPGCRWRYYPLRCDTGKQLTDHNSSRGG